MVIIGAWMQHPSAEFLADPMFERAPILQAMGFRRTSAPAQHRVPGLRLPKGRPEPDRRLFRWRRADFWYHAAP